MRFLYVAALCFALSGRVSANMATVFIEDVEVGATATKRVQLYRSGWDAEREFFLLLVGSDTGQTYAIEGQAKRGVVNLPSLEAGQDCDVRAKVLSKVRDRKTGRTRVEVEILDARSAKGNR